MGEYRDHQIKANGLTQLLSKYYEWLNQADDEDSICKVLFLYIVNLFPSIRRYYVPIFVLTNRVGNVFTCSYCWQVPKPTLYDFEPFLRLTGSWGVEKWKKDYAGDWVCETCVDAAC